MNRSKRYRDVVGKYDSKKIYPVEEACELIKSTSFTRFDSSIELVLKLNLDTTKAEQQLRGTITLPYYFGKKTRVLVLDDTITKDKADAAGIQLFGGNEQIQKIKEGWFDFDVIIANPKFMIELGKLGKILGPKGLMPNPKLGTVTINTIETAKSFLQGKYSYRTDTYGNIHLAIAKVSSDTKQICENIKTFVNFIKSKRPTTVKGEFIQKMYLCSSMGPSVKVDFNKI